MANEFITPRELAEDLRAHARQQVATMPLESVRRLAAIDTFHPGLGGGLLASLVLAARDRIEAEKGET